MGNILRVRGVLLPTEKYGTETTKDTEDGNMASDTLTRWGTALVTTALAAAVVVGCAPEQPAEDGKPVTETGDGTAPGMDTESGQDAAASDSDSDGSEAAPDGAGTSADAGSDDSQDVTSAGAGY